MLEKLAKGEKLSPQEQAELNRLEDFVKNGRPLDETHPGFSNLSPEQQDQLKDLLDKLKHCIALTPDEVALLNDLQDLL